MLGRLRQSTPRRHRWTLRGTTRSTWRSWMPLESALQRPCRPVGETRSGFSFCPGQASPRTRPATRRLEARWWNAPPPDVAATTARPTNRSGSRRARRPTTARTRSSTSSPTHCSLPSPTTTSSSRDYAQEELVVVGHLQQVIDMGDGCAQMLETVIGCTLDDAFALLAGRGFCPPIVHRPKKRLPARHVERAGRRGNRWLAGTSRKRLKGLEPSTFCMASRP